ncbi:MAG: MCE family protein [Burkholderiales bacterium]|nr:MCE family protein [Burkholderiales bacterium]
METKVNYTVVGVFVLLMGGALLGIAFWLSAGGQYQRDQLKYHAYFDESVAGLNRNAPVRYRGVEVGRVIEIALAPDQSGRVQILMRINRDTPIKQDTVAKLKMQGLTGLASLELSGGSAQAKPLTRSKDQEYPVIPTKHSFFKQLDTSVNGLITNLTETSENINALTDEEMRKSFKRMITNMESVTRMLAEQRPAIEAVLKNSGRTFESSAQAAEEVGKLAKRLNQTAGMMETMASDVSAVSRSARITLDDARQPLRDLSGQTLPELNALSAEMRELAVTMKRVGTEIEQQPEMLIFGRGQPRPGPGE